MAALVGGGTKFAGYEIPVLKNRAVQVVLGIVGLGLMYVAYDNTNFRARSTSRC